MLLTVVCAQWLLTVFFAYGFINVICTCGLVTFDRAFNCTSVIDTGFKITYEVHKCLGSFDIGT